MPLIRPLPQAQASITFSVHNVHHDRYLLEHNNRTIKTYFRVGQQYREGFRDSGVLILPLRGLITRRADVFGIQSVYFRTSGKDVSTRFVPAKEFPLPLSPLPVLLGRTG